MTTQQVRALTLGTLAFALSFMVWGLISPLATTFQKLFDLTNTQVSLLIAVPVLLGSVGRLPLGILTDQFGGRKVFTILMAGLLVPLALMVFASSFFQVLAISLFLGIAGASFAVGVPFVSKWFPPEKQGAALGIYGAGTIGQAGAAMVAPRMATAYGWPAAFWVMLLPLGLFALLFYLLARDAEAKGRPASFTESLRAVQSDSMTWLLAFFYFLSFGGFVAFSNYIPKLYSDLFGLTREVSGSHAAVFVFLTTAMRPVGGWLGDKIRAALILPWLFAVAAGGALLLLVLSTFPLFHGAVLLIGFVLGLANGVVFKLVPEYFPGRTGTVTGIVGAMGGLGGFFPPLVMGAFRDSTGSYAGGFVLLCVTAAVALGAATLLAMGRWPRRA